MSSAAALPEIDDSLTLSVTGLGYVGLPLAAALSTHFKVIGFDTRVDRVEALRRCEDDTGELDESERGQLSAIHFTTEAADLSRAQVHIVAVPTPVDRHTFPDFGPLESASRSIGGLLKRGDVVIYESTVYPGATEEVCVPVLEDVSGLRCNVDFHVGYSPERINPGDRAHRLPDIVKVTSGSTPACADFVDALYRRIIRAGTHRAPDIRTAEAAKAIENTQRDVNIALMNELAQMFERLGMDTEAVLKAAGSKWNFLPFRPGLVGGHCIGVDPYYLIHRAQEAGYFPELITAARRINDRMAGYVCSRLLRLMALHQINVVGARVLVMGLSFKENCPDLRNSQVEPIIEELRSYHAEVDAIDPWVDADEAEHYFALHPISEPEPGRYDAVLLAVAHRQFAEQGGDAIRGWLKPGGVLFDIKHLLPAGQSDERL